MIRIEQKRIDLRSAISRSIAGSSLLFLLILFCGPLTSLAQEKDKWGEGEIPKVEVVIEKDRQITVPQAIRNFEKVPPRPAEPIKPEIIYSFKSLSFTASEYNPSIRPLKLKAGTETISKIYGNYVSAGFGNYSSPYAEAYFTNKRDKNKYYGAKFYHRSFMNGPVDAGNSGSGNTEMRLFGKAIGGQLALGGFFNYENITSHFYGYKPGEIVSSSSIRQSYSIASFGGEIENSRKTDFKYKLSAGYSHLNDRFSATESETNLNLVSEYKLDKERKIIINADYFLISRNDSLINSVRHLFKVKPAYQFKPMEQMSLLLGANVAYENDTINKQNGVHFYPNVMADYALSENTGVYAGLTGDVDKVSLHSLAKENVWVNSNIGVFNTNRAIEFSGGMRGKVNSKVSFNLGLAFTSYKNFYYYQSDTGKLKQSRFNVFYDDGSTKRTNLFGEIGYSASKFRVSVRGDYWSYSSSIANQIATRYAVGKTFENDALQRPNYRLAVKSVYNVYDKLLFEADFIAQGGAKALDIEGKQMVNLNSAADLNLRANYFVSKQFSVFLNFNNILSSNYQMYLNYPVRGFQVLGGASWSF